MATSSTSSNTLFNGNSRYSSDFQAVITRATAIASLPITQLNNQKTTLNTQTTAMTGLDTKFSALQAAIEKISGAVGGGSFESSVSDTTKLATTIGDGALEGNYSIQVVAPGAYASSMTAAAWTAAAGNPHPYKLSLGGTEYSLYANDNSIGSVASAINSQYGDKVRAVVVNVGSSTSPDYRLSLQATKLGDLSPDLLDSSVSLQAQQTTGSQAQYIVNGSGNTVSSDSRNVTIATGVTATLLAASASAVNITVTRSTSALSSGLDAFATAYNAAVDEVDHQHGTTSGPLAGQSLISALSQSLSSLSTYSANGTGIHGLADLGLDLDKTGHLTFSSFKLLASDLVNSTGVTVFLGSTTGGGFLKLATDKLTSIQQVGTGLLPSAEAAVQSQITSINGQISTQQDVVDRMTAQLQERMAAADALIASMEQQYSYIYGLFSAQQTADKQYG